MGVCNVSIADNTTVSKFINNRGEWDLPKITSLLPTLVIPKITSTPFPLAIEEMIALRENILVMVFSQDPNCKACRCLETINHIFKGCTRAQKV